MLYHLLLLDDVACFGESHDQRRQQLWSVVRHMAGQADIGTREKTRVGSRDAPRSLGQVFAQAIFQKWKGLVLKGCQDLYTSLDGIV